MEADLIKRSTPRRAPRTPGRHSVDTEQALLQQIDGLLQQNAELEERLREMQLAYTRTYEAMKALEADNKQFGLKILAKNEEIVMLREELLKVTTTPTRMSGRLDGRSPASRVPSAMTSGPGTPGDAVAADSAAADATAVASAAGAAAAVTPPPHSSAAPAAAGTAVADSSASTAPPSSTPLGSESSSPARYWRLPVVAPRPRAGRVPQQHVDVLVRTLASEAGALSGSKRPTPVIRAEYLLQDFFLIYRSQPSLVRSDPAFCDTDLLALLLNRLAQAGPDEAGLLPLLQVLWLLAGNEHNASYLSEHGVFALLTWVMRALPAECEAQQFACGVLARAAFLDDADSLLPRDRVPVVLAALRALATNRVADVDTLVQTL